MAFDPDLNVAAEAALGSMVDALVACLRLDPYEAYALCSMACDLRIYSGGRRQQGRARRFAAQPLS